MHEHMLRNLRDSIPIVLARKIENIASKMAGQRRDVTVLVVSIANLTGVSQALSKDELYGVVDDVMHALADVIYEYEGTIDKLFANRMIALFGLPINHGNDPERAVRAALKMLQVFAPLHEKLLHVYGMDVHLQMGVNTGLVIAGNLGNQYHMEYTVIGDTVNLASLLESQAEPGSALVSFRTYQRTHPIFHYERPVKNPLKEDNTAIRAYRPVSLRNTPSRVRGLPGLQVPMVNREQDLQRLEASLARVTEQRSSQVVFLSGDAGIGKTRLVAEFCNLLTDQPVNITFGSCSSYLRITPYRVIADLLRNIIHESEVNPDEAQREALVYHLQQLNLEHADIPPYLTYVLGLSEPDPFTELRLKMLEPSMLQRQIHSALRAFFVAEAHSAASVLIIDDLDWIDPASRDFLEYFIQSLEDVPILLALIGRDFSEGASGKSLVSAAEKRGVEAVKIHLEPLSDLNSQRLIDQLLHTPTSKGSLVKDQIIARALGNPYFIEELVRILFDNGGLVQQNGSWQVNELAGDLLQEVPGTLQDIILARFDFLPEPLKDTLQRASILQSAFGIDLLKKITDDEMPILCANLKELENRGFLERVLIGSEEGYSFKHPLVQETIYNTQVKRDLRLLHLRIAQAIEEGRGSLPGEQSDVLAFHYSESTTPYKAIPYLIASAENAAQRFANETAVQYSRQALALMDAWVEATEEQAAQVQIGLGRALKFTGGMEEAVRILESTVARMEADGLLEIRAYRERSDLYLESLRELADIRTREGKLDLAVRLLQQGLEFMGTLERPLAIHAKRFADRLAWVYFRQGKVKEAFLTAGEALDDALAWEHSDPITLASLYNTLGGIHWMRSNYKEAINCVRHSLQVYKSLHYTWGMAIAYTNLGVLLFTTGKWPEALANLEQADDLRTQNGYLPERPTSLKNLGEVLFCAGQFEQARQKFETSLEISQRFGMNIAAAYAEIGLCRLFIFDRKFTEARQRLDNARQRLGSLNDETDERLLKLLLLQAELETESGNHAAGLDLAQKSYRKAVEGGFSAEENEALVILGRLYTRLGKFGEAERSLQDAVEISQDEADQYGEAQALFELGQLHLACSQAEPAEQAACLVKAERALQNARALYAALGANHRLARIQTSLHEVDCLKH